MSHNSKLKTKRRRFWTLRHFEENYTLRDFERNAINILGFERISSKIRDTEIIILSIEIRQLSLCKLYVFLQAQNKRIWEIRDALKNECSSNDLRQMLCDNSQPDYGGESVVGTRMKLDGLKVECS
jgi:hypothetical protein